MHQDQIAAPSKLETHETENALATVFGIYQHHPNESDIKSPELIRIRRVFDKSNHATSTSFNIDPEEDKIIQSNLIKIFPDSKLEDNLFAYRKEIKRYLKLKEVPFKSIGIPMPSISDKICSLLEDELITEISLELETIFNEYAENFLGQV